MSSSTPNYGLVKPTVQGDRNTWGGMLNGDMDIIDAELFLKADKANPVFTGSISAPVFIGTPSAILRPTVDGVDAIQLQNAAGVAQVTVHTGTGTLRATNLEASTTVFAANVQATGAIFAATLNVTGVSTVAALNASGTITAVDVTASATVSAANVNATVTVSAVNLSASATVFTANVQATGVIYSPLYIGNPRVLLRPTLDDGFSIQLQNSTGTPILMIDTGNPRVGICGAGVPNSPFNLLSVGGAAMAYNAPASGTALLSVGRGVGQTDAAIRFGHDESGGGIGAPCGWIQASKPGTANHALLLNALGGSVVVACPASGVPGMPPNSLTFILNEATNQLVIRVAYSTGVTHDAVLALP